MHADTIRRFTWVFDKLIGPSEILDRQRSELARWWLVRVWLSG
jgi:hypothetical protein